MSKFTDKVDALNAAWVGLKETLERKEEIHKQLMADKSEAYTELAEILTALGIEGVHSYLDAMNYFSHPNNVKAFKKTIQPILDLKKPEAHAAYKKAQELPDYISEGVYSV